MPWMVYNNGNDLQNFWMKHGLGFSDAHYILR